MTADEILAHMRQHDPVLSALCEEARHREWRDLMGLSAVDREAYAALRRALPHAEAIAWLDRNRRDETMKTTYPDKQARPGKRTGAPVVTKGGGTPSPTKKKG